MIRIAFIPRSSETFKLPPTLPSTILRHASTLCGCILSQKSPFVSTAAKVSSFLTYNQNHSALDCCPLVFRSMATSRQKRSGQYREQAAKNQGTTSGSSSSIGKNKEEKEAAEALLTNEGQPHRFGDTSMEPPQVLLPNTDLTMFRETPSLLHDTPYTTLRDLQQGAAETDSTGIGMSSTPPSTVLAVADLGALKDLYDPALHLSATVPTDWSDYEPATPLWEEMAAWIGVAGRPISVADYMRLCLTHPVHGYYTQAESKRSQMATKDEFDVDEWDDHTEETASNANSNEDLIIGPTGDFITAPEMSQIFGECLGIWCMTMWQLSSPRPSSWQWLEAGPGKGSLMADLIRFTYSVDKIKNTFGNGCRGIHFIEQSPILRDVQRKTLQNDVGHLVNFDFSPCTEGKDEERRVEASDTDVQHIPVFWHDTLASFQLWQKKNNSFHATFAICQEFLDALPVYAFEKTHEGWRERLVDIAMRDDVDVENAKSDLHNAAISEKYIRKFKNQKKPRLRLVTAPEVTPAARTLLKVDSSTGLLSNENEPVPIGSVLEVNPEGILFVQELARIVDQQGGGALIIDYGQEGSHDSIRAFARHEQVHFLSRPGEVDVTADVDFAAMRHSVNSLKLKGAQAFGPIRQGDFLMSMGAQDRAIHLIESDSTSAEDADNIYQALVRLCDPKEMGERFKVLAIAKKKDGLFQPPGF